MKKLLVASMFAALAFAATACGDSDSTSCDTPTALKMLGDINSKVTATVDTANMEDATKAATECTAFAKQLKEVMDPYKDMNKDDVKAEWSSFKSNNWLCMANLAINGALQGLNFATKYKAIEDNTTYCTSAVVAGAAMATEGLSETFTSVSGWHDILQAAADATAEQK